MVSDWAIGPIGRVISDTTGGSVGRVVDWTIGPIGRVVGLNEWSDWTSDPIERVVRLHTYLPSARPLRCGQAVTGLAILCGGMVLRGSPRVTGAKVVGWWHSVIGKKRC